jgi:hypothetical protein
MVVAINRYKAAFSSAAALAIHDNLRCARAASVQVESLAAISLVRMLLVL